MVQICVCEYWGCTCSCSEASRSPIAIQMDLSRGRSGSHEGRGSHRRTHSGIRIARAATVVPRVSPGMLGHPKGFAGCLPGYARACRCGPWYARVPGYRLCRLWSPAAFRYSRVSPACRGMPGYAGVSPGMPGCARASPVIHRVCRGIPGYAWVVSGVPRVARQCT